MLHGFDGTDGEFPNAPLSSTRPATSTARRGTAARAAPATVFALKHSGSTWNETVLHSFNGTTEGLGPAGGVVLATSAAFSGRPIVYNGQTDGTVYELVRAHRAWHDDVLADVRRGANGCNPYAGLIADAHGNLYGTTIECGTNGDGVAFEMVRAWQSVLHRARPPSVRRTRRRRRRRTRGSARTRSGNLYGTTVSGGATATARSTSLRAYEARLRRAHPL